MPTLGAKVPQAGNAIKIPLDIDNLAIFDRYQRAAAAVAVTANRTDDLGGRLGLIWVPEHHTNRRLLGSSPDSCFATKMTSNSTLRRCLNLGDSDDPAL